LRYNPHTDRYEPVSWDDAFALIGRHIREMDHPNQMELYTSGRASNEASYLYQLFGRMVGTNNFPDCSNMCHEASGAGLKRSIGIGKGTIHLTDFEQADAIFVFGQNPGTNHPRMLTACATLPIAARVSSPLIPCANGGWNVLPTRKNRWRSSPRGQAQSVRPITSRIWGDMAAVRGMAKALLETHRQRLANGEAGIFDDAFIAQHTTGIEAWFAQIDATSWQSIEAQSGLSEQQLRDAAAVWQSAGRVCTWAMGITQHKHSLDTVREIVNLQLLGGHLGKPGAGCARCADTVMCSNRTMGLMKNLLPPCSTAWHVILVSNHPRPGHHTVAAIQAMLRDEVKVLITLGGNLAAAAPDTTLTCEALKRCGLTRASVPNSTVPI
jgi:anaerobic selenocysteine-containing dehydrogenase